MQLAVSAPVADTLWTVMLLFLLLIILGICVLYAYSWTYPVSRRGRSVRSRCWSTTLSRRRRLPLLSPTAAPWVTSDSALATLHCWVIKYYQVLSGLNQVLSGLNHVILLLAHSDQQLIDWVSADQPFSVWLPPALQLFLPQKYHQVQFLVLPPALEHIPLVGVLGQLVSSNAPLQQIEQRQSQ